jgi:hypothetical protein
MVLTRVIATHDLSYCNCARAAQLVQPPPPFSKLCPCQEQYQITEAFNYNCSVRYGRPSTHNCRSRVRHRYSGVALVCSDPVHLGRREPFGRHESAPPPLFGSFWDRFAIWSLFCKPIYIVCDGLAFCSANFSDHARDFGISHFSWVTFPSKNCPGWAIC